MESRAGFVQLSHDGPTTPPRTSTTCAPGAPGVAPIVSKQGYMYTSSAGTLPTRPHVRYYYALRSGKLYAFEHTVIESWRVDELAASISNDEGPSYKDPDYGETLAYPNTFALVSRGKTTIHLACQNAATRTSWITALATNDAGRGCIGYLLVQKGKGKWTKLFFSILSGVFTSHSSRVVSVLDFAAAADCSVSLNSVQSALIDPSSGKEMPCCSISVLEGARLTRLFVRSASVAADWVTGMRSAISRNKYLAYYESFYTGRPSALSAAFIGTTNEDELVIATKALSSPALSERRAGAWAFACLSCEATNRELICTPETPFCATLVAAAASPDEELSLEAMRALGNLAATPRVHAQLVAHRFVETLFSSGLTSPYMATLETALRALKTLCVYRGLPESETVRFRDRLHALKADTAAVPSLAPLRPLVKELGKALDKLAARDAVVASENEPVPAARPTKTAATRALTPRKGPASPLRAPAANLDDSFERFMSARAVAAATVPAPAAPVQQPSSMQLPQYSNPFSSPLRFRLD